MAEPATLETPRTAPALRAWLPALLCLLAGLLTLPVASGTGITGFAGVLLRGVGAAALAGVYLASAAGLGALFLPRLLVGKRSLTLETGAGLAVTLTATHLLGWAGLLGGSTGTMVAWAALVPGLVGFGMRVRPAGAAVLLRSPWALPGVAACGLLLAAATMTPGFVWRGEFGGFDALSYHLTLPQEWMRSGAVRPFEHNVYSFLPSYLEAAFLHVAQLGAPGADGMLAGDGLGLRSAQMLHAMVGVCAALATGRVGTLAAERMAPAWPGAGPLAFSLSALTPWAVVAGSLAYNEMALVLMLAACGRALFMDMTPAHRWALCALLVGAACAAKPTALFMVGGPVAVGLLAVTAKREWLRGAVIGALIGALMLAPWMVRNWLASGNPVFPFAAKIFANASGGTGHWTAEQVSRYAAAHKFTGSWSDRVRLAVIPDTADPMGVSWRGVTNPQWGLLLCAAVALAVLLPVWTRRRERPARAMVGVLAAGLLAQLVAWLAFTHIQSRFLLPTLPTACVLVALAAAAMAPRLAFAKAIAGTAAAAQMLALVLTVAREPSQVVAAGLIVPVGALTKPGGAPAEQQSPEHVVNTVVTDAKTVLLVGHSTPLYFTGPVRWATAWDESALAAALGDGSDAFGASRRLRDAGIEHVFVNFPELDRLLRSGFLDPRLAPERVARWMSDATAMERGWRERGWFLVRPLTREEREALQRGGG